MARYIDVEGYRKLFDEEYKKTRELIYQGETHLDNIAEGFSEASRVIDRIPTADVVPKSEVEKLKIEIESLKIANEKMYEAFKAQASEIFAELRKESNLRFDGFRNTIIFPLSYYNEIQKKYTEGEQRND